MPRRCQLHRWNLALGCDTSPLDIDRLVVLGGGEGVVLLVG
jgi:hypothetical protein